MRPLTPALEDLLELLEALDRHIRPIKTSAGATPTGDLLLLRPLAGEIYDQVDALIVGIRSIDAECQRYRGRLTHLPAAYLCTAPDGTILEANLAAGALLGLTPDQVQGIPLVTLLHPGCIPAFQSVIATLAQGKEVPVQEFSILRRDGSTFPAAVAVSISRDPAGGMVEYLWSIHDRSGQKEVEETLRESREYYQELTANISDAFITLDREGRIISRNRAAARLSGNPEEVLGKSIYDAYPDLRNETIIGLFREVLETGRPGANECRFHLHGQDHFFEVRAIPTREGISIHICDISDRRKAEKALQKSGEVCRRVIQGQTEMICRWRPDGTITFVNDVYGQYTGTPRGDLIGRHYASAVPADDLARIQQTFTSLTPDHPVLTTNHRVVTTDGRTQWHQWTDMAFFDEQGSVIEYQSVGRDISDARMAKEALLLANRKLNLLSDVTRHDILNRLNVLSGYIDLSREQTDDPELLWYYQKEEEAIRDIRRYMIFTGEYRDIGVTSPKWQDVSDIIRQAAAGLDSGQITVEVRTGDLEVYADPLIVRVFANLIDNSLRHGGGVTQIRVFPEESDPGISIIYEDNGIGIPYPEKEEIFRRGVGRQTGLGLFLVREILAITDITIEETGEPGEGVRFEIGIPPGFYRFNGPDQAR